MIEILLLHLDHVRVMGAHECDKIRRNSFMNGNFNGCMKLEKNYVENFSDKSGIDIQIQY